MLKTKKHGLGSQYTEPLQDNTYAHYKNRTLGSILFMYILFQIAYLSVPTHSLLAL